MPTWVIETTGEWTAGATVVDLHHYTGRPATARVAIELDRTAYWTKLVDAITLIG